MIPKLTSFSKTSNIWSISQVALLQCLSLIPCKISIYKHKAIVSGNYMDIFSINKNQTFLIYVLYKSLLKLTILSNVSSRRYAPRAMLLMLARQQAYSS